MVEVFYKLSGITWNHSGYGEMNECMYKENIYVVKGYALIQA